jgi:hypothetical protein
MITANQTREAIALLGWTPLTLAVRALLALDDVSKALDGVEIRCLGGLQLGAVREALEASGIEFQLRADERGGVRLRNTEP